MPSRSQQTRPGWPQRRRTAVSFLFCSACDDLCTLFISIISAQFSGGEKPSEQKGQHTEWCFLQHFASETERRWGSCPRRVGIKDVLLPFSGQGMIWQSGRTVGNNSWSMGLLLTRERVELVAYVLLGLVRDLGGTLTGGQCELCLCFVSPVSQYRKRCLWLHLKHSQEISLERRVSSKEHFCVYFIPAHWLWVVPPHPFIPPRRCSVA